jgi:hypothetical protein
MAEGGRAEGVYEFGDFRLLTARSDGRRFIVTVPGRGYQFPGCSTGLRCDAALCA